MPCHRNRPERGPRETVTRISLEARLRACPANPPHAGLPAPLPEFAVVSRGDMRAYARGPQLSESPTSHSGEGALPPLRHRKDPCRLVTVHWYWCC